MTILEVKELNNGDEVTWTDPDDLMMESVQKLLQSKALKYLEKSYQSPQNMVTISNALRVNFID